MKRVGIPSKIAEAACFWTACPARVTILDDPKFKHLAQNKSHSSKKIMPLK